jgi:hypothetical protein
MFDFKQLNDDLKDKSFEEKTEFLLEIKTKIYGKKIQFLSEQNYERAAEYRYIELKIIDIEKSINENN